MIDRDPLSDMLLSADDGSGIPEISNAANPLLAFSFDQNKAASCPALCSVDFSNFSIYSLAYFGEHSLDVG